MPFDNKLILTGAGFNDPNAVIVSIIDDAEAIRRKWT